MSFYSAHINMRCTYNGEDYYIFGLNQERQDLDALGGHRDNEETLEETLTRECMEESLGSIPLKQLKKSFDDAIIYTSQTEKGLHYCLFVYLGELDIPLTQEIFKRNLSTDLPEYYQENSDLIFVPVNEIMKYFPYIRDVAKNTWLKYLNMNILAHIIESYL